MGFTGKLFLTFLALAVSLTAACVEPDETESRPIDYYLFADSSLSVGPEQATRWCDAATALVFNRLRPGDGVVVYPVNDRTDEVAPLYEGRVPAAGIGRESETQSRRVLAEIRQRGRQAVSDALRVVERARQTRLLAGLRRVSADPGRETRVIFLTDGRESSPALDLESTRITDANLVRLVEAEAARGAWRPNMLGGISVTFVLDSPGVNRRRSVNDHAALERFWRLVVSSLGGRMVAFDSRVAL